MRVLAALAALLVLGGCNPYSLDMGPSYLSPDTWALTCTEDAVAKAIQVDARRVVVMCVAAKGGAR